MVSCYKKECEKKRIEEYIVLGSKQNYKESGTLDASSKA